MAFTFVFSLIPLFATSLAFFTAFPGLQDQRERVLDLVFAQLLPEAVQEARGYLERFGERAAAAGAVSSIIFVLLILLLFQSVESSFNRIWKVERPRTWGERLQGLAFFLVAGAIALAALFELRGMAGELASRVGSGVTLPRAAVELGSLAVAWGVFTVANRALPNTAVRWAPALLGGVVVGTIWHLVKGAFTWYVEDVASYANIYGTLGTVPAFFLWVWLSLLLLLLGAHLAFVAQNLRALVAERGAQGGVRRVAFYGVAVTAVLARAFRERESPLRAREIAARLNAAPYLVTEALVGLVEHDVVLAISAASEPLYAIARPSDSISVGEIVTCVAGEDLAAPEVDGGSELERRVGRLFAEARERESGVLDVSIAELERDAPGLDGAARVPERTGLEGSRS